MRRGTVLIIVLGVLVLLALLATSFATLQSIERKVTRNYTDDVRAKLVAQSGVEAAVDKLQALAAGGWYPSWAADEPYLRSWQYFGTETDETRAFELQTVPGEFGKLQKTVAEALNPSFAVESDGDPSNPDSTPSKIKIEGRDSGYSGVVGGTYKANGDLYTLKVLDCQSQINLNDGVRWGNRHSVSQNLRRILNALGAQPEVNIANLGGTVLNNRPPTGFISKVEIKRLVGDAAYDRVRDLITVHSRSNPNVVNPVPLSDAEYRADLYPVFPNAAGDGFFRPVDANGQKVFRYGHGQDVYGNLIDRANRPWPLRLYNAALEPAQDDWRYSRPSSFYNAVWTRDSLNPQWIETVERSPVNVNTASRPVLMALTVNLQGFFELARRRPVPFQMFYQWQWHSYEYSPDGGAQGGTANSPADVAIQRWDSRGSECGYLYPTVSITGPGTSQTQLANPNAIPASLVVDEILACRYRKNDYATQPFAGPFRSWQQFNRFCDYLVEKGVLADSRPIFFDYQPSYTVDRTVFAATPSYPIDAFNVHDVTLVDSPVQRRIASQAIADVLKANFNPNCHLNELNPDRNLYTLVDKTDLICHSTEFCFTPMGRFEIESLGYVLASPSASGGTVLLDDALTTDNRIIAMSRVDAVVELYAPIHETTQKQFYQGRFGERQALPTTNNGRATECGPEPANGVPPLECEYDGYVALPTIGGAFDDPTWEKNRNEPRTGYSAAGLYGNAVTTPTGDTCSLRMGAAIHSHLQFDHCAHHHEGGADKCRPIGRWANPSNEQASLNRPDKTETFPGPYSPVDSALMPNPPGRFRLCHSFAMPPSPGWTAGNSIESNSTQLQPLPPLVYWFAPSDLRIDGAYTELNSAFGYDLVSAPFNTHATFCFWVKPNFTPECNGKIRTMVSLNRYEEFFRFPQYSWTNGTVRFPRPLPGGVYFFPSYTPDDPWRPHYLQAPRANSFMWALAADGLTSNRAFGLGIMSPTMNHEFEPRFNPFASDDHNRFTGQLDGQPNHVRAHEWTFVTMVAQAGAAGPLYRRAAMTNVPWAFYPDEDPATVKVQKRFSFFINGREQPGTEQISVHMSHDDWPSFTNPNNPDPARQPPDGPTPVYGKSVRLGGEYTAFSQQQYAYTQRWVSPPYETCQGNSHYWFYFAPYYGNTGTFTGTYPTYRQYFADSTLDEFYYWRDDPTSPAQAMNLFAKGRYYRPIDPSPDRPEGDALFTSQPMTVQAPRILAPGNSLTPSGGSGDTTVLPNPIPDRRVFLTAIQWTALAEDVTTAAAGAVSRLKPVMGDYRNLPLGGARIEMSPPAGPDANSFSYETVAQMFVQIDGPSGPRWYGPYHNEVWCPIRSGHQNGAISTGTADLVEIQPGETVRYIAKLRPGTPGLNTLLLATPVLDDVTLYVEYAHARYLSYAEVRGDYR